MRVIDTGTVYEYEYETLAHAPDSIIKRDIIYTLADGNYLSVLEFNSTLATSTAFKINSSYVIYDGSFEIEAGEGYRDNAKINLTSSLGGHHE